MSERPIDLGPLDPKRDALRWERLVQRTTQRAIAARRPTLATQVVAWARPALAMAAAAALMAWGTSLATGTSTTTSDPTSTLLEWARLDQIPGEADPTGLYGVTDVE